MLRHVTWIAILLAMFGSSSAFALYVDPRVDEWIQKKTADSLSIVVVLKADLPQEWAGIQARTPQWHARILNQLQGATAQGYQSLTAEIHGLGVPTLQNVGNLWIARSLSMTIDQLQMSALLKTKSIESIYVDYPVTLSDPIRAEPAPNPARWTWGLEKIHMPQVWTKYPGLTGAGILVGVIDTGVDPNHPDLAGKVVRFKDFYNGRGDAYDDHGHGTHVSGTIAGGHTSGRQIGVAPGARLIEAKVFSSSGSSTLSKIVAAMQWMADPDGNPNTVDDVPRIVSNSWGGNDNRDNSPFYKAIETWRKLQIYPSFAAGNSGTSPRTIDSPGAYPISVAVGATDINDGIATFSSRGPAVVTIGGQPKEFAKPEISAPGVSVLSSLPGGQYEAWSGTSMATPHLSGLVTLLFQARPNLDVETLTGIIGSTADDLGKPGFDYDFGVGRINALRAIDTALDK